MSDPITQITALIGCILSIILAVREILLSRQKIGVSDGSAVFYFSKQDNSHHCLLTFTAFNISERPVALCSVEICTPFERPCRNTDRMDPIFSASAQSSAHTETSRIYCCATDMPLNIAAYSACKLRLDFVLNHESSQWLQRRLRDVPGKRNTLQSSWIPIRIRLSNTRRDIHFHLECALREQSAFLEEMMRAATAKAC